MVEGSTTNGRWIKEPTEDGIERNKERSDWRNTITEANEGMHNINMENNVQRLKSRNK